MTKEQTPKDLVVGQSKLDRLEEALGYLVIRSLHHFNFFDDVLIGGFKVTYPAEILNGLFATAFAEKPTWCFLKHDAADQDHTGWHKLHGKWDEELVSSSQSRRSFRDSKDDPEADKATGLPSEFVQSNESTSNGRRSDLGQEDGDLYSVALVMFITQSTRDREAEEVIGSERM